jgi:ATP-binding cassette, subfamily B, bacterial
LLSRIVRRAMGTIDGDSSVVAHARALSPREVGRRFWPYTRGMRGWIAGAVAFTLLAPPIEAAQIWLFKLVIDEVLVPKDFGRFPVIALFYVGLATLDATVSVAGNLSSAWVGERFLVRLRTDLYRHLQRLSLDFFESRRLGDLLSRLTGDVSAIESFLISGFSDLAAYALSVVVFAGALFVLDWRLALVSLFVVPLFWSIANTFSRAIKTASREKRRRAGSISAVAEEALGNIALVQAYNAEDHEIGRFERENEAKYRAEMASARLRSLFSPFVDIVELAGGLVVIGFGTWELSRNAISLGGLLVFMTFLMRLYSPIRGITRLSTSMFSASASGERIAELFDETPQITDGTGTLDRTTPKRVTFKAVSFWYPNTTTAALHDVSFSVAPGEIIALVGESGAGKSTIAKLLLRFYDPSAGTVLVDGRPLQSLRLTSLRDSVAVVMQETLVFDATIRENIAYGRPGASDADIVAAARAADADDFIRALPDGYETIVGQRGRRLSGGQRQRIAIARAMLRDAPILILDEPTTGLDTETANRVLDPIRRLMMGRTTIVISHDLLTVRDATNILVLDHGRILEEGTHDTLINRGGVYARLYGMHAAATLERELEPNP